MPAAMAKSGEAKHYLLEAYKHLKPIVVLGAARPLLASLNLTADSGLLEGDDVDAVFGNFAQALGQHRVWAREARRGDRRNGSEMAEAIHADEAPGPA